MPLAYRIEDGFIIVTSIFLPPIPLLRRSHASFLL